ncbi:MAG: amidohydrolase family protein, partial [Planctomycetes bacterium]|nr:amidohydrolase family protein [Planctomycetota bacterium]
MIPEDSRPLGPIRVLREAELVLPDRLVVGDLCIQDTRIHALSPAGTARGDEVHDARGWRIYPGFIDLHTHGGWGFDFDTGSVDDYIRAAEAYGRAGVTRLLATLVPAPWNELIERVAAAARHVQADPAYLGLHLEGPFLAPNRLGALPAVGVVPYTDRRMEELLRAADGTLRVMTFAPEVVPIERIPVIQSRGVILSIGHTSATHDETRAAVR